MEKDENYYLQGFLKEFQQIKKEKKIIKHITGNLKFSSDDSNESDEE